jgi:hypothetical protein
MTMKISTIVVVTGLVFIGGSANARTGVPSGRGSTSGDPAASSATPRHVADDGKLDEVKPQRKRYVDVRRQ